MASLEITEEDIKREGGGFGLWKKIRIKHCFHYEK